MKVWVLLVLAVLGLGLSAGAAKPNMVFILCDDLGIGDLGCYGQEKLKTPHIDSLATSGMKFENHYSGSTVCAPSRSSLMTGQHTGHTYVRGNNPNGGNAPRLEIGQMPLPKNAVTLPKLLQKAGYETGMFGKWGLGGPNNSGATPRQGFDEFFGYYCQSHGHTYYPKYLWRNREKIELDGDTYSHDLIWDEGLEFIRDCAKARKPFFTYYSITVPHAAMTAPPALHEKWCGVYPEFNDKVGHYGGVGMGKDGQVRNPIAGFAAMMENLDNQVGELIAELKQLGVYDNTIIIFTSDNGTHREGGHNPDFWNSNGPYRGVKRDLYEGGIHAPLLVSWPKHIEPGSTSDHICAFWDWLPTLAQLGGAKVPSGTQIDGISMVPTLAGKPEKQQQHPYLYWEFTEGKPRKAVRAGKWKAVCTYSDDGQTLVKAELFDLETDPGETTNLAEQQPDKMEKISAVMESARSESEYYRFRK